MFVSSYLVISSPTSVLIISFIQLTIILMLMSLQRLSRTKMNEIKFALIQNDNC